MSVEDALRAIIVASFVLFALSVLFGISALGLRVRHDWHTRRIARLEERWTPTLMLVLAGEASPEDLWAQVRRGERLAFLTTLVEYAKRLRGAERRLLNDIARPYLHLLARQLRAHNREVRARAVHTLATLGLPEYADTITRALDDSSRLVAMKAAHGLARPDLSDRAAAVIDRLGRFSHWNPRYLASMLERFGLDAAPLLRQEFANPLSSVATRVACATALAGLNDPEAADVAAAVTEQSTDSELLVAALTVLATMGGPRHSAIVMRLAESEDEIVRGRAIATIPAVSRSSEGGQLLEAVATDPSAWVALRAADGLRALDATEVLEGLAASTNNPRGELAREVLADGRDP